MIELILRSTWLPFDHEESIAELDVFGFHFLESRGRGLDVVHQKLGVHLIVLCRLSDGCLDLDELIRNLDQLF